MVSVSILTPTWNRDKFLPKVYDSLLKQTNHNFEWIVVNDGSEDETDIVMKNLLKNTSFPIIYAKYDTRVGKCRADNTLLDLAESNKVLWCDSDDILVEDTIETMLTMWNSIPNSQQNEYIAIIGLCADESGKIQNTGLQTFKPFSCTWNDLSKVYGMTGDMCIMQNKELIGNNRFLEVDLVMSESGFWKQFMNKKVLCIPNILKVMTRDTDNRISGSSKMEYCRGKAYSIFKADNSTYSSYSLKRQIKLASNLIRYSIHGDIKLSIIYKNFRKNIFTISFSIGGFLGFILSLKDKFQNRVVKTHLIFEKGKDSQYTIERNKAYENQ